MAAEFESGFFAATPAWHGQGVVLQEAPTIEEAIKISGTDWKVYERPLYVDLGQEFSPQEDEIRKDDVVVARNIYTHKAIVRETDNRVLGIVGKDYAPVQNEEAFKWFDPLLESGEAKLEAGGSLRNGQRVWVLAKMKGKAEVIKQDEVESYLLLANSHDGSLGLTILFTPIRVVCMNTLQAALHNKYRDERLGKAISIKHTAGIKDQMEIAKKLVDTTNHVFSESVEAYKQFAATKMSDEQFESYFNRVFYGRAKISTEKLAENEYKKSERLGLLKELFECGTGQNIKGVRGTVWAGYNAFTEFADHYRGEADMRLSQTWFGEGASMKTRAFKEAMELVKEK